MIESILDKVKRRGASAEVFLTERASSEISFEAGKLKNAEQKTALGIGLRVISEGRIGFASTTDPIRIEDLVNNALNASRFGKKVHFEFPGNLTTGYGISTFDPAVESYSPDSAVKEGKRAVDMLRERCPKGLTDMSISTAVTTIRIANTSGLDASCRSTDFREYIMLVVVEDDSILMIDDGNHFSTLDIRTDAYVEKIAALTGHAEKKAPGVSGMLPVLFTAQQMPGLLQAFEMGFNGRRMVKGDSPLIGKEGVKILGGVTLVDDPFIGGSPGSRPFDDEGIPSQRTVIFEDGVFRSFLFNLDTAAQAGRVSTANAQRGLLSAPAVGTSNLVMSPGKSSLDEMIKSIDEGVIVHGVLGGGQSNLLAGDFALNIMLGFLVRKGEISGRLVDTMVSGNVYQAFGSIAASGSEIKPVGSVFVPDVMFSALPVSSQ
jgi:PmbA protein